jgi:thiamine-phosphate pyrophosphorylase
VAAAPGFVLILVTDEGPDLAGRVERALAGGQPGRVAVQLRHRQLPAGELLALARVLRRSTARHGAALLVNDRIDIALAVEADGVQLPSRGLPPGVARQLLGSGRSLGASCHDAAELARAAAEGADFALLAPVFAVPGKGPPLGLAGFAELARACPISIYGLGGISDSNVSAVLSAGAHGVAVMRHVLGAPDPGPCVAQLLARLSPGHSG